jgi:hypothetical protein
MGFTQNINLVAVSATAKFMKTVTFSGKKKKSGQPHQMISNASLKSLNIKVYGDNTSIHPFIYPSI